jgi:hypothetical protein
MKTSNTLPIQAEILCKGLGDDDFNALIYKVAYSESVVGKRARGEALVSTVKEREETPSLNDASNFFPLFLRRIYSRRVVCTSMEKDDTAALPSSIELALNPIAAIETLSLLAVYAQAAELHDAAYLYVRSIQDTSSS